MRFFAVLASMRPDCPSWPLTGFEQLLSGLEAEPSFWESPV